MSEIDETRQWPALEHFDTWNDAVAWALALRRQRSPKYLVRWTSAYGGKWEVIQAWLRCF